jgi:hypothetical protein
LLAAFSSIFVVSTFLHGQDAAADRSPAAASVPASSLSREPGAPRDSRHTAPVWIPPPGQPRSYPVAPPVLQQLARAAGIIFSGQVTFVGSAAPSSGQYPASTTVTFQVEQAMRGASPGQTLTIHEWAGLRTSEHYYVGERVFLFLYSPGKLGLTSPVAGGMGRFAMNSQGKIVMSPQHVVTLAKDPILGGKTVVSYADFAQAVLQSSREE